MSPIYIYKAFHTDLVLTYLGEITNNQIWDKNGNPVGSASGAGSYQASTKSSSEWQGDVASSTEQWVEPSSSSSSSSQWVEPSSSSSSSKWTEPSSSSSQWTEPSSSSSEERKELPTHAAVKNTEDKSNDEGIASVRLPILAAAHATTTSSSSSAHAEETKPTEESKPQAAVQQQKASSFKKEDNGNNDKNEVETCNDKQGQWRCDGKALQQCIQTCKLIIS